MSEEAAPARRLTLGVMGHVDHGKTALVGALTGMDTDRLPEEKRRGVSIALGFAHARFGEAEVDFIDMPGHERFVRTLVSGATGVDAALLVVAANEGVKPQTREHLDIAVLLGLHRVLPVVSKADLADADRIAVTLAAVAAACHDAGAAAAAPAVVSLRDGRGLAALKAALAALAAEAPTPPDAGFPWLPVDRAFTIAGRGTVVTGTLRRGGLDEGAPLVLAPSGRPVRVRGLQVHGRSVRSAVQGERVAVNLRDLDPSETPRGSALTAPDALEASRRLSVEVRALASAPPLATGARVALLVGAAEVQARLRLLDRQTLAPGAAAIAEIETAEPVAVPAGERFVLRTPSPARTVGGGAVIDPAARRLARNDAASLAALKGLTALAPHDRAARLLAEAGARGQSVRRLALLGGEAPERLRARLHPLGAKAVAPDLAVATEALDALAERIATILGEALDTRPNGLTRRALAAAAPDAAAEVLDAALRRLSDEGRVSLDGGLARLAPPRAQAQAEAARALAFTRALGERLRQAALTPPDLDALAPTPAARRAVEALVKAGVAVKTLDRVQKRQLVFHRQAVADACARLAPHLAAPGLTVGEAGARLGVSRKFTVPLLEYLDAARFTRRLGDRRVLGPAGPPC